MNPNRGEFSFTVPGKVKAKQSFKFNKAGRRYQDKDVLEYANHVKACCIAAMPDDWVPLTGPVGMEIDAFFAIPKGMSKKLRERCISSHVYYDKKPDRDNIAKNVQDALNEIAYMDDKQIVRGGISKRYSDVPRVEITIYWGWDWEGE